MRAGKCTRAKKQARKDITRAKNARAQITCAQENKTRAQKGARARKFSMIPIIHTREHMRAPKMHAKCMHANQVRATKICTCKTRAQKRARAQIGNTRTQKTLGQIVSIWGFCPSGLECFFPCAACGYPHFRLATWGCFLLGNVFFLRSRTICQLAPGQ